MWGQTDSRQNVWVVGQGREVQPTNILSNVVLFSSRAAWRQENEKGCTAADTVLAKLCCTGTSLSLLLWHTVEHNGA
jgi:hypothetical protein